MRGENQRFQAPKLPTDFFFLLEENTVEEKAHVIGPGFGLRGCVSVLGFRPDIFQVQILEAWPKMDRRVKGR